MNPFRMIGIEENSSGIYCVSLQDIKDAMLVYYYPDLVGDYNTLKKRKYLTKRWSEEISREFIYVPLVDNYGVASSIYLAWNGSPPKGRALISLVGASFTDKPVHANVVFFGNGLKISRGYDVIVDDMKMIKVKKK
jgi:hypothetical protein